MAVFLAFLGGSLIILVLWEGFETIVFPRRVTRRVRITRLFYRSTWRMWGGLVGRISSSNRQDTLLSYFGPFSLLLLLSIWAGGLVVGFALLHKAVGSAVNSPAGPANFLTDLYLSGTTFFTLGLGDVVPLSLPARMLVVAEAGMGFGFLALVIGYLPALNQSFSRREVDTSLLDARAGSPPTACEMLLRHSHEHGMEALRQLFHDWELWSAEFLESHLSYPVLAFFRSQHDNQSWLAALTAILDASAFVMVGLEGACVRQAELTFAMARHAVIDLSIVFSCPPREPEPDRLSPRELGQMRSRLTEAGLRIWEGGEADQRLKELRHMYEPYVYSLSRYLRISLPPWISSEDLLDNWQTSPWDQNHDAERLKWSRGAGGGHF